MTPGDLSALLGEDRWIRQLAARLVGDRGVADDLVQEAWATALASAEAPRVPRAWLAGVVRNLWRDRMRAGGRRQRRERAAARDEALPSSAELAAEIELRKRVAEAVLALEEPLRRTLALRYFQDRSLQSIADAEGVAVSTVHEREQRALAKLRLALDGAHGGPRGAWCTTMISLARWPSSATSTAAGAATAKVVEALAMGLGTKLFVSAVLVIGAGAAWWWSVDERAAASDTTEVARGAPTVADLDRPVEPADALPARQALPESPASVAGATESEVRAIVTGRVLDAEGNGCGGVLVAWKNGRGDEPATSGADGTFRLAYRADESVESESIACTDEDLVTLVAGNSVGRWTVVVAPAATFAGRVVDEQGAPVEGAELVYRPRETVFRAVGLHAWSWHEEDWTATSDGAGRFRLSRVAGGAAGVVRARANGFREREIALPESSDLALEVVLERPRHLVELSGTVLDPLGAPLPGASVSAGREIVLSDDAGRFVLPWGGGNGRFVQDESGTWREEGAADGASVIALKEGFLPASAPLSDRDLALPFTLRLGSAPRSISGTVRDAAGAPLRGLVLWVGDPTRFGREPRTTDDGSEWTEARHVEESLCGSLPAALTEEHGRFRLDCLMDRDYSVLAFDPRTASRAGPWTVPAGASGLDLVFSGEPTARVSGRIVSARGKPRPGFHVVPRRGGSWAEGAEAPQLAGAEYGVETDADGRFEFSELATGGTTLQYEGPYTFEGVALESFADLGQVEIVAPELCELQVELVDPTSADRVEALDAAGGELETMEVTGMENGFMVGMGYFADLVDGRSRLLLIKETVRTIVLSKGGAEVLRIPVELVPGERTVLRP